MELRPKVTAGAGPEVMARTCYLCGRGPFLESGPTVTPPPSPAPPASIRRRLTVRGVVQGVGFRPFVYRLARALGLAGSVRNAAGAVRIEVQGSPAAIDALRRGLLADPPPLAAVEAVEILELPAAPAAAGFRVLPSLEDAGEGEIQVSPDVATCDACLAELEDPSDRRHRYPFLNCTDCGPRFTLIAGVPYDRARTTMRAFVQCPACAAEYGDPGSRRFHAEPNACPACGPRLSWAEGGRRTGLDGEAALARARELLARGGIVAVKGVGGFHLACDAADDGAVRRLREGKGREEKPFALMVRDLETARRYAHLSAEEGELLASRARPIVLLRRRSAEAGAPPLSPAVAPGQETVGLLLPYSPLHPLLLAEGALVLTSGNRSGEPIARTDGEALAALGAIADGFLLHDREIHAACDDSVSRVGAGSEIPIRRSRGYAPLPLPLPFAAPPLVAAGGELKAVFCLAGGRLATLSQHLGDLGSHAARQAFERAVLQLLALFRIEPERVACDLHPDYASSRWAEAFAAERGLPLVPVQHHHAHVASLLAEQGEDGARPVLGVAFDGTGYGADGTLWGGEILLADYSGFRRLAHLRPVPMPGGEAAIRHPGRMALSYLRASGIDWSPDLPCVAGRPAEELRFLARQLDSGLGAPLTSSAGRLFDAAAALLGLRQSSSYEGQAAMELEALAGSEAERPRGAERGGEAAERYRFAAAEGEGGAAVLDPAPLFRALIEDLAAGVGRAAIAGRFHDGVAAAIAAACRAARAGLGGAGPDTVALTGGVFQNARLLERVVPLLGRAGFRVLRHRRVPPNDGGLALGQAAVAAAVAP